MFSNICAVLTKCWLTTEGTILYDLIKPQNPSFDFLAVIKGIPKSPAINYSWKWIETMNVNLDVTIKPADRECVCKIIPPVFKQKFPKLTCIIDCFNIFFFEYSRNLHTISQTYSHYKGYCTGKILFPVYYKVTSSSFPGSGVEGYQLFI